MLRRYRVYGVTVSSDMPLALPELGSDGPADVEVRTAAPSLFRRALSDVAEESVTSGWWAYAYLPDGSFYARWEGVGEFLVSASGRCVDCRPAHGSSDESFQVYMLCQALSFALVEQGLEPLHATAVAVGDQAIAFLGGSGYGKSTIASHFVAMGHRIITDDVLILEETGETLLAHPGPPRVKLFPEGMPSVFADAAHDVPLNPVTEKKILALRPGQRCPEPVPLCGIYALVPVDDGPVDGGIRIESLSPREAFIELVGATYNARVRKADRLRRQFSATDSVLKAAYVRRLIYPRSIRLLPDICGAILRDAERSAGKQARSGRGS
jgi:hypothetical protein